MVDSSTREYSGLTYYLLKLGEDLGENSRNRDAYFRDITSILGKVNPSDEEIMERVPNGYRGNGVTRRPVFYNVIGHDGKKFHDLVAGAIGDDREARSVFAIATLYARASRLGEANTPDLVKVATDFEREVRMAGYETIKIMSYVDLERKVTATA